MDFNAVVAVIEVQENDPKSAEKALGLSSYLDKTAKETESDDEVTFFDLAKATDKADEVVLSFAAEPMVTAIEDPMEGEQTTKSIQSKPVVAAIESMEGDITAMEEKPVVVAIEEHLEGGMLSPKLEEVLENDPNSSEIPLETESDDEVAFIELEDTKEKPKAELADKADLVSEVEEPSEPEMKPVNSFEEEAAHGTLPTALKRSYDHVEISSLPEKKARNDDSELQDEAGDVTPEEPIKALEEKEPQLDLIPEPEIKSDADPFGLEFSQEIVGTMSHLLYG